MDVSESAGQSVSLPSLPSRAIPAALAIRRDVLQTILVLGAFAYVLAFIVSGIFRLVYPFGLEGFEYNSLMEVRRILHGEPIYVEPALNYVPYVYGPVYFYVSAAIAAVVGSGFIGPRIVSLAASVGSMVVLYLLVSRETQSRAAGATAAGFFAACAPLVALTMDDGRVDALCSFLMLASAYAARTATGSPQARGTATLLGGGLAGAAILTKQSAAALAVALGLYLVVFENRRAVLAYLVGLGATVAIPLLLLRLQSGPWAWYFVWDLPRRHAIHFDRLGEFWVQHVLPRCTLPLVLGPAFLLVRLQRGDQKAAGFYSLLILSLMGQAWISLSTQGGFDNVLNPAYAALAILFGLGLHAATVQASTALAQARGIRAYLLGLGVLQLAILLYNPRLAVPYQSDLWADQRLAATLSALPGTVFAPGYGTYLLGTPNEQQPDLGALSELGGGLGGARLPEADTWDASLVAALQQRRIDYVVNDPNLASMVPGYAVNAGYVRVGPLLPPDDPFWLWKRSRTPAADIYVPKERVPALSSSPQPGSGG